MSEEFPRGRPSKLTPEVVEKAGEYLRLGAYVETVAAALGIHRDTFYAWLRQGEEDTAAGRDTLHAQFSDTVTRASATAELGHLASIAMASKRGNVQDAVRLKAAAWFLKHRYPDRYAEKVRTEHSGDVQKPVQVRHTLNLRELSDDDLAAAERLARRLAGHS